MGLIQFGSGVSKISGKVGETVYARNRGGNYARAFAIPDQPSSGDQTDKWDIWVNSATAWGNLGTDGWHAWREYAPQLSHKNRLGEPIKLSAQQVFTECYTNAALLGLTPLDRPSNFTNRPAFLDTGLIVATAAFEHFIVFDYREVSVLCPSSETGMIIISAAPVMPASRVNVNNDFRIITTATADGPPIDLKPAYEAKFGTYAHATLMTNLRVRAIDPTSMLGSSRILLKHAIQLG